MNKDQISEKLQKAMDRLKKNDSFIISENANERSMTHTLAKYLVDEFPEYHVDCEYNRMTDESGMQIKKQIYGTPNPDLVAVDDLDAQTVFPDIIIHRREDGDHNLLIVEAKKNGRDARLDYEKLNAYMRNNNDGGLGYKFSAFVVFDTKNPENSTCEIKDSTGSWQ